jgi:hypothetical protein
MSKDPGDKSQGSDIYSSDIADADDTKGGNLDIRDDGTTHSTQYGDGWNYSWGTSDRYSDQGHDTIHHEDD